MASLTDVSMVNKSVQSYQVTKSSRLPSRLVSRATAIKISTPRKNINRFIQFPVSDHLIYKNIRSFTFSQPQLFIDFLSRTITFSEFEIKKFLRVLLLISESEKPLNLIKCIAYQLGFDLIALQREYLSKLDPQKVKNQWKELYPDIKIDTNKRFDINGQLSTFEDFSFLFMLASAIDCRIDLVIPVKPANDNKNPVVFSQLIGPSSCRNNIIILCQSPNEFYAVRPYSYLKEIKVNPIFEECVRRIILPNQKYSFFINYYSLLNKLKEHSKTFNSIKTSLIQTTSIIEPSIHFSVNDYSTLTISAYFPCDNIGHQQFCQTLQMLSDDFIYTEPAIPNNKTFPAFSAGSAFYSNQYIVRQETFIEKYDISKIKSLNKPSDIKLLSSLFSKFNYPPASDNSSLTIYDISRLLLPFSSKDIVFESEYKQQLFQLNEKLEYDKIYQESLDKLLSEFDPKNGKIQSVSLNQDLNSNMLEFDVQLINDDEIQYPTICKKKYFVHSVEQDSIISSSAIAVISTELELKYLSPFKNQLLAIFFNPEKLSVSFYLLPLAKSKIENYDPIFEIPDMNEVSLAYKSDGSYAIMCHGGNTNSVSVLTHDKDQDSWACTHIGDFPGSLMAWHKEDLLYIANDDVYWIVDFNSDQEDIPSYSIPKTRASRLAKLLSTPQYIFAIYKSGECVTLEPPTEEEDSPIRFKIRTNICDAIYQTCYDETGILSIDSKGKLSFSSTPYSVSSSPVLDNDELDPFFPNGILQSKFMDAPYSAEQVALTFLQCFPTMIGFYHNSFFHHIRKDLSIYRAARDGTFIKSTVQSVFKRNFIHSSLHSIEEIFSSLSIKVKPIVLIDNGYKKSNKFIDAVFGTTFVFCCSEGLWANMKVFDDQVYLFMLIKNDSINSKTCLQQLVSSSMSFKDVFVISSSSHKCHEVFSLLEKENVFKEEIKLTTILFMKNTERHQHDIDCFESLLIRQNSIISNELFVFEDFDNWGDALLTEEETYPKFQCVKLMKDRMIDRINRVEILDPNIIVHNTKLLSSYLATFAEFDDIPISNVCDFIKCDLNTNAFDLIK